MPSDDLLNEMQRRLDAAVRPLVSDMVAEEPRQAYELATALVEAARGQVAALSEVRATLALRLWESLGQPTLAEFGHELGVSTPRAHQLLTVARQSRSAKTPPSTL